MCRFITADEILVHYFTPSKENKVHGLCDFLPKRKNCQRRVLCQSIMNNAIKKYALFREQEPNHKFSNPKSKSQSSNWSNTYTPYSPI